ncbi:MAG: hypothetical protein ACP5KZ_06460 [bacterium]
MKSPFKERAPFIFRRILDSVREIEDEDFQERALKDVSQLIARAELGDSAIGLFKQVLEIAKEREEIHPTLVISLKSAIKEAGLGEKAESLIDELWEIGSKVENEEDRLILAVDLALKRPEAEDAHPYLDEAKEKLEGLKRRARGKKRLHADMFMKLGAELTLLFEWGLRKEAVSLAKELIDFVFSLPRKVLPPQDKLLILTTVLAGKCEGEEGEELLNLAFDKLMSASDMIKTQFLLFLPSFISPFKLPPKTTIFQQTVQLAMSMSGSFMSGYVFDNVLRNFLKLDASWEAIREAIMGTEEELTPSVLELGRIRQMAEREDFSSALEEAEEMDDRERADALAAIAAVVSRKARED